MFDPTIEEPIPFTTAARLPVVGKGRGNRPRDPETLKKWATHGCGGVKLEAVIIGGGWHTSIPALLRFIERRTMGLQQEDRTPSVARKSHAIAERALAAAGI
jgi:hypothetical protein